MSNSLLDFVLPVLENHGKNEIEWMVYVEF